MYASSVNSIKTEDLKFLVRQAHEIADVFEPVAIDFDDEESESENEDRVETASAHESEEDVESEVEQLEDEGEESSSKRRCKSQDRGSNFSSKSGFVWIEKAEPGSEDWPVKHTASPKGQALSVSTPLESWAVLFTDEILNIIMTHTNEEIDRRRVIIKEKGLTIASHQKPVDLLELKALIGLLYFAGLQKVNNTHTKNLWSPFGISLFRLTMQQKRFQFLLVSMRFDDKDRRTERKMNDRLANVREIWEIFIANCKNNYEPHTNCTIDEQLLSFRGRCSFKIFLPGKSDGYGLKIVTINDAATNYLFNAIPYVGIVDNEPNESVPSYYVRKLSEPIYGTGRTITCNNWFTSIPICEIMKNHYDLRMVGTIRKNNYEIPEALKKLDPQGSNAQFAYHEGITLVSYNPKAKKIILLLSSMHGPGKIERSSGKPEIVLFYDKTKGGTDGFNRRCHDYSTARKTFRWTMRFFYGMLDQANVNSLILYTLSGFNEKTSRYDFISDLSLALIQPLLARRLTSSTLRTVLRVQIEALLNHKNVREDRDPLDLTGENKLEKQKRCRLCPTSSDRKTFYKCLKCERPMCKEHIAKICCRCSVNVV